MYNKRSNPQSEGVPHHNQQQKQSKQNREVEALTLGGSHSTPPEVSPVMEIYQRVFPEGNRITRTEAAANIDRVLNPQQNMNRADSRRDKQNSTQRDTKETAQKNQAPKDKDSVSNSEIIPASPSPIRKTKAQTTPRIPKRATKSPLKLQPVRLEIQTRPIPSHTELDISFDSIAKFQEAPASRTLRTSSENIGRDRDMSSSPISANAIERQNSELEDDNNNDNVIQHLASHENEGLISENQPPLPDEDRASSFEDLQQNRSMLINAQSIQLSQIEAHISPVSQAFPELPELASSHQPEQSPNASIDSPNIEASPDDGVVQDDDDEGDCNAASPNVVSYPTTGLDRLQTLPSIPLYHPDLDEIIEASPSSTEEIIPGSPSPVGIPPILQSQSQQNLEPQVQQNLESQFQQNLEQQNQDSQLQQSLHPQSQNGEQSPNFSPNLHSQMLRAQETRHDSFGQQNQQSISRSQKSEYPTTGPQNTADLPQSPDSQTRDTNVIISASPSPEQPARNQITMPKSPILNSRTFQNNSPPSQGQQGISVIQQNEIASISPVSNSLTDVTKSDGNVPQSSNHNDALLPLQDEAPVPDDFQKVMDGENSAANLEGKIDEVGRNLDGPVANADDTHSDDVQSYRGEIFEFLYDPESLQDSTQQQNQDQDHSMAKIQNENTEQHQLVLEPEANFNDRNSPIQASLEKSTTLQDPAQSTHFVRNSQQVPKELAEKDNLVSKRRNENQGSEELANLEHNTQTGNPDTDVELGHDMEIENGHSINEGAVQGSQTSQHDEIENPEADENMVDVKNHSERVVNIENMRLDDWHTPKVPSRPEDIQTANFVPASVSPARKIFGSPISSDGKKQSREDSNSDRKTSSPDDIFQNQPERSKISDTPVQTDSPDKAQHTERNNLPQNSDEVDALGIRKTENEQEKVVSPENTIRSDQQSTQRPNSQNITTAVNVTQPKPLNVSPAGDNNLQKSDAKELSTRDEVPGVTEKHLSQKIEWETPLKSRLDGVQSQTAVDSPADFPGFSSQEKTASIVDFKGFLSQGATNNNIDASGIPKQKRERLSSRFGPTKQAHIFESPAIARLKREAPTAGFKRQSLVRILIPEVFTLSNFFISDSLISWTVLFPCCFGMIILLP